MSKVEIVARDGVRLGQIDEAAVEIVLTPEGEARLRGKRKKKAPPEVPAAPAAGETAG